MCSHVKGIQQSTGYHILTKIFFFFAFLCPCIPLLHVQKITGYQEVFLYFVSVFAVLYKILYSFFSTINTHV